MIRRTPTIRLADLVGSWASPERLTADETTWYAGSSRFALQNLLKLLGIGPSDAVLLPAYICEALMDPLDRSECQSVFYGIDECLQIDWETLQVPRNARAIITVNYFGASQNFPAIDDFRRMQSLVWINDNAHGFSSCLGETPLEAFGDFSLTSFYKSIGGLHGCRVRINNPDYLRFKGDLDRLGVNVPTPPRGWFLASCFARAIGWKSRSLSDFSRLGSFPEREPASYRCDDLSLQLLAGTDEITVRSRRISNYREIATLLQDYADQGIFLLDGFLQPNNVPLVVPIRVEQQPVWRTLLHISRQQDVDVHTWPSLPAEVILDNLFGAVDIWQRHLFLPIHHRLVMEDYLRRLERIFDAVRADR
jgi:hypothetical protein